LNSLLKKITEFFSNLGDEIKFAFDQAGQWISKNILQPVDNFFKGQCTCSDGNEQSGLICYPKCRDGFYGVMTVCYQNCPDGFRNDGAFCFKPYTAYGRGGGYALWDRGLCEDQNSQGCEQWGLMYYPICDDGFYGFACCICSPKCPDDMTDIGISCTKNLNYGRGVGFALDCSSKSKLKRSLLERKRFKKEIKKLNLVGQKQAKENNDYHDDFKKRATDFGKGLKNEKDKLLAEQDKAGKELKKKFDLVNTEKDPKKKEELKKKLSGEIKLFSQRQLAASRKLFKEHKAKKKAIC